MAANLVLGADGYLARHLVNNLVAEGESIQCFDRRPGQATPGFACSAFDINDAEALRQVDWNVSRVFVMAGVTGTIASFTNYAEFVRVNETGLLNVLDAISRSKHRPKVIFPSTRLVYKGGQFPASESAPKEAKTVYAVNKLACEGILEAYQNLFEIPFAIYRIGVPYGNTVSNDYSYGTVGAFLKQAGENARISLYGDGSMRRTFTHVQDVCQQIISSSADQRSDNEIFNLMGEDFSLKEIAELIAAKYRAKLDFIAWPELDLRIESGSTVFDSLKFESTFDYRLQHSVQDWLLAL